MPQCARDLIREKILLFSTIFNIEKVFNWLPIQWISSLFSHMNMCVSLLWGMNDDKALRYIVVLVIFKVNDFLPLSWA